MNVLKEKGERTTPETEVMRNSGAAGEAKIEAGAGMTAAGEAKERLGLGKEEKLRLKTLVGGVFEKGTSLYDFPLRLTYRALGEEELESSFKCGAPAGIGVVQMLITVPKKKRRRAVDRVLMRRRIREAYRLNRNSLKKTVAECGSVRTLGMAFIYIHGENADYALIEKKMRRLLAKVEAAVKGKEKDTAKGKEKRIGEEVDKGCGKEKDGR